MKFRIEIESHIEVVSVRYLSAKDYFDAYKKALKFGVEVIAIMTAADFFNCVIMRGSHA